MTTGTINNVSYARARVSRSVVRIDVTSSLAREYSTESVLNCIGQFGVQTTVSYYGEHCVVAALVWRALGGPAACGCGADSIRIDEAGFVSCVDCRRTLGTTAGIVGHEIDDAGNPQ